MHCPDGILSTNVTISTAIISFPTLALAIRNAKKRLDDRFIPVCSIIAAFVFLAQMINIPLVMGTSGHFLGAVLISVMMGPSVSIIIMSVVLTLQALAFGDGGILALGANILNMGILGSMIGYYGQKLFVLLCPFKKNCALVATAVVAFLSSPVLAAALGVELALSGVSSFKAVVPLMVSVYLVPGILEALATVAIIKLVSDTRPDIYSLHHPERVV